MRDWIELAFRVDPDNGGALDWGLVGAFAALSDVALLLTRRAPSERR